MKHTTRLAIGSCLQAVDPVLVGKVRAKQYYSDDHNRSRNLGVLLHGDGSFSGQGVVYETLDMSALQDYTVGGVIHLVVNNQVRNRCCEMRWLGEPLVGMPSRAQSYPHP